MTVEQFNSLPWGELCFLVTMVIIGIVAYSFHKLGEHDGYARRVREEEEYIEVEIERRLNAAVNNYRY